MTTSLKFLLFCLLLFCCGRAKTTEVRSAVIQDKRIVLFNTADFTRLEIASYLNAINKCNPIAIGLIDLFPDLKDDSVDHVLAESIRNSGKVILSAGILDNDSLDRSHPLFANAAKHQGVTSYITEEDGTSDYFVPLFQNGQGQEFNLSYRLYFEYQPVEAAKLFEKVFVNEPYRINYTTERASFIELDPENLTCENITGKIVLLGYLDSNKTVTDPPSVDHNSGSYYNLTILVATVLVNFLDQEL